MEKIHNLLMIFLILQKTIVSFVLLKLFLLFEGMIAPCNMLVKKSYHTKNLHHNGKTNIANLITLLSQV